VLTYFRRYFIAGVLVWVPLGITVLIIKLLVEFMDRSLLLLPPTWRPEALLGVHIPGLGIVLALLLVMITGVVAANLLGRRLVTAWESVLSRIPFVRNIYSAVKQLLQTVFSAGSRSFRRVLLVEYPRKGLWTICFQTGRSTDEILAKIDGKLITVFIPTTPNPTSGFVIMVSQHEVIELDMSIEDGLKLIMSLGMVIPPTNTHIAAVDGSA
jgi:uncharacterized membrane protein